MSTNLEAWASLWPRAHEPVSYLQRVLSRAVPCLLPKDRDHDGGNVRRVGCFAQEVGIFSFSGQADKVSPSTTRICGPSPSLWISSMLTSKSPPSKFSRCVSYRMRFRVHAVEEIDLQRSLIAHSTSKLPISLDSAFQFIDSLNIFVKRPWFNDSGLLLALSTPIRRPSPVLATLYIFRLHSL